MMNRRVFLKQIIGGGLLLLGLGSGSYYYARNIEPKSLHIQEETILLQKIPPKFHNFKIVQFSDTHLGFHYTTEQFSDLIATINEMKPDMVVFTGDFADRPQQFNWSNNLIKLLQTIHAPYGKYWVYGNHDHGGYGTEILRDFMKQANFQLLQNEHTTVTCDKEKIIVAGIDDAILGNPDISKALQGADESLFTILLAHEPDMANEAKEHAVDVQFSGHSHGGQVRFPVLGHLYTPAFAKKYIDGKYHITEDFSLYVNKGIGTTRLPFRFLCKPEIHVYTLQHQKKA